MVTSLKFEHAPSVTVQRNTAAPEVRPVTVDVLLEVVVMLPFPETLLHAPVPLEGLVAPSVAEVVPQESNWLLPAAEVEGILTVTFTESDFEHPVAVIVSVNLYVVVDEGLTLALEEVEVNPLGLEVQL